MRDVVRFFDNQFKHMSVQQVPDLNPFEQHSLPYLKGPVLDYGCSMGNLSVPAARQGHATLAVDTSRPSAICNNARKTRSLKAAATLYWLLASSCLWTASKRASRLTKMKTLTYPNSVMVCNVLTEGTSYLDMFGTDDYCLFTPDAVQLWFKGYLTSLRALKS